MRVLHVIPSVGPARGGPSVAVRLMADACAGAGATVDVAATNDNERALLDVPLATPLREGNAHYRYFKRDCYPYTVSRDLARWLRQHVADYDVVHTHALFSFATVAAARAAHRRGVPYIVRPLGTLAPYGMAQHKLLKRLSWSMFERNIVQRAAAVQFTSVAEQAEAQSVARIARAVVIPLGLDLSRFSTQRNRAWLARAAPHLSERTVCIFLSRLHPKKRLEMVLAALAAIPEPARPGLIVAGSGQAAYVAQLQALSRKLDVAGSVYWAGQLDFAQKAAALQAADAFVLPSVNENFGISVVEALASGLPVVLTRGVAIHGEVARARAGLVCDDTVASLADALRQMCEPAQRALLARQARPLAEDAFSLRAMRDGLMDLYARVTT